MEVLYEILQQADPESAKILSEILKESEVKANDNL